MEADQGGIKTYNGSIHGHFDTFGELILSTSNGRIQTKVGLTSIGGSKAKLSMSSANGYLSQYFRSLTSVDGLLVISKAKSAFIHLLVQEAPSKHLPLLPMDL